MAELVSDAERRILHGSNLDAGTVNDQGMAARTNFVSQFCLHDSIPGGMKWAAFDLEGLVHFFRGLWLMTDGGYISAATASSTFDNDDVVPAAVKLATLCDLPFSKFRNLAFVEIMRTAAGPHRKISVLTEDKMNTALHAEHTRVQQEQFDGLRVKSETDIQASYTLAYDGWTSVTGDVLIGLLAVVGRRIPGHDLYRSARKFHLESGTDVYMCAACSSRIDQHFHICPACDYVVRKRGLTGVRYVQDLTHISCQQCLKRIEETER